MEETLKAEELKAVAVVYALDAPESKPKGVNEKRIGHKKFYILTLVVVPKDTSNEECCVATFNAYRRIIRERHPELKEIQPEIHVGILRNLTPRAKWIRAFFLSFIHFDTMEPTYNKAGEPTGCTMLTNWTIAMVESEKGTDEDFTRRFPLMMELLGDQLNCPAGQYQVEAYETVKVKP